MLRIWLLVLLGEIAGVGQTDTAFDKVPFDSWLKGGSGARIQWSLSVATPVLTELQRLRTSVAAVLDESEGNKQKTVTARSCFTPRSPEIIETETPNASRNGCTQGDLRQPLLPV